MSKKPITRLFNHIDEITIYHRGRWYAVKPWEHSDLMQANEAFARRGRTTREQDREEQDRIREIRKAVNQGCYQLVEIEGYEV